MRGFEWLLGALAGWTAIGLLGTAVSLLRADRPRARRGILALAAVWALYVTVLIIVSRIQPQQVLAPGQEQCFDNTCFSVTGVSSTGEFKGRGGGRLLQVGIRVRNRSLKPAAATGIHAWLADSSGRRWSQTAGVGGIRLDVQLPPGASTQSEPVFRIEGSPAGLGLILTRGWSGWGRLTLAHPDSLTHRPTLLTLPSP